MTNVIPEYVSALEARDIRRYPKEIAKIPERDSVASVDIDRNLAFSQIVSSVAEENPTLMTTGTAPPKSPSDRPFSLWQKQDFGFGDIVDIINPLQHLPIVATIYRNMTGDKIGFAPRVIGGAIWGRLGGFVSGVVNAVIEFVTGKDVGDHIFNAVFGPPVDRENAVAMAPSVKPVNEMKASKSATDQPVLESSEQMSSWQNSFAFEDPFAELTGHLAIPSVNQAVQSARPATSIVPAKLSALDSYGRNAVIDGFAENSRFRAVA
jgi:hypothetical protein